MSKPYDDYIAAEIAEAANDPGFDALALTLASCTDGEAELIKSREIAKADHLKAEAEKAERQRERTFQEMDNTDFVKALSDMNNAEYFEWLKSEGGAGRSDSGASLSEAWGFSRGDHMKGRDDE